GVVVVVELLRDAGAGTVDRQHLKGVGGRVAPVPAAGVEHPVEVAVHDVGELAGAGPGAGLRGAGVGTLAGRPGGAPEEPVELGAGRTRVGLLLAAGSRLAGEQPPVVGAAGGLGAGAVGVHQRIVAGQRVQVGHRADVVGALHHAITAGPDRGG